MNLSVMPLRILRAMSRAIARDDSHQRGMTISAKHFGPLGITAPYPWPGLDQEPASILRNSRRGSRTISATEHDQNCANKSHVLAELHPLAQPAHRILNLPEGMDHDCNGEKEKNKGN